MASLILNGGGSGGNTFTVQATPSGVPVTINAGAGDDVVNVGSAANSIDNLLGALTVNGQGGNNILNINDQGNLPLAAGCARIPSTRRLSRARTRVSPA